MSQNNEQIGEGMLTRIMQYCDGTLDPQAAAIVAREIAADPTLQALADDLTLGADAARDAFAPLANQPVPLALARNIIDSRSTSPQRSFQRSFRAVLHGRVAAAILGLVLGAASIGLWLSNAEPEGLRLAGVGSQSDGAAPSDAFRAALLTVLNAQPDLATRSYALPDQAADQTAGQSAGQSAGQGSVSVIRWFQLASGISCAEFTQEQPAATAASGIACHRADGGWEVISFAAPPQ